MIDSARVPDPLRLLRELLARYPVARISALLPDGNPTAVPEALELGPQQVRFVSPGLAGYSPEDRPGMLAAFDRALKLGVGHTSARPLNAPDAPLHLHLVDVTADYNVVVSISVLQDGAWAPESLPEVPTVPPRVARIQKSNTAVVLDIDEATTSILGWTRDEVVGRRSLEFIHPDDQQLAIENWLHLMTNPKLQPRARLRHQARDGSWLWFETSHSNLLGSDEACVLTEMVDISNEMAAQQALEAREQLLHQLTQTLPVGVFQINADGQIIYTNDRLFEIVGVPRADSVMAQLSLVVPTDQEALTEAIDAVLHGAVERNLDVQLASTGAAGPRMCQISLRPLISHAQNVVGAVGCVADVTESVTLRRELERRATFDSLTGCRNRAATLAALQTVLDDERGRRQGIAVVFVDLDLFKSVNDRLGHGAGNELLVHAANQLEAAAAGRGIVGRIGGDEFLVVCPNVRSAAAAKLGECIATALREDVVIGGRTVVRSASVGVAWSDDPQVDGEGLVAESDVAMYESKRARQGTAVHRIVTSASGRRPMSEESVEAFELVVFPPRTPDVSEAPKPHFRRPSR